MLFSTIVPSNLLNTVKCYVDSKSEIPIEPQTLFTKKWWTDFEKHVEELNYDKIDEYLDSFCKPGCPVNVSPANVVDENGSTLLHYIAKTDYVFIAEYLLLRGCDVNRKNKFEDAPIIVAVRHKKLAMIRLLFKAGASIDHNDFPDKHGPLHVAAQLRHFKIVEYLIERAGCDIDASNDLSRTPLHEAVNFTSQKKRNFNFDVIKCLVLAGAHLNGIDIYGRTPLHYAMKWGEPLIIQLLLHYGASIDIYDNDKNDPLMAGLILWDSTGQDYMLRCIEIMLERGADVCNRNRFHQTLIGVALKKTRNRKIIDLLLNEGALVDFKDPKIEKLFYKSSEAAPERHIHYTIIKYVSTYKGIQEHVQNFDPSKLKEEFLIYYKNCNEVLI